MEQIPSVDKSPQEYDKYVCTLSPMYVQIAAKALRENETLRQQSLDQMREWIAKDPYIKHCRTDSNFLLRFLRTKKYNVPVACALLQKFLINREMYPKWFKNLDLNDPLLIKLLLDGFFLPLPEKDEMGRQIIIFCFARLDHTKYTSDDVYRLMEMSFQAMYDDEESQIAGFVFVFDYSGITMSHVGMFSLLDFKNFLTCVRKGIPLRITCILVLKMPAYLQPFYEITYSLLSTKLQQRFIMYKTLEDFQKVVKIEQFPIEYGGQREIKDILADFQKKVNAKHDKLLGLDEMSIDIPKDMKEEWYKQNGNSNIEAGIIGSFRKLEVD